MSPSELLPLAVVIPIVGALLSPLAVKLDRRLGLIVGAAAMAGTLAVLVVVARTVYSGDGHVAVHYFSGELPVGGRALGIAFAADPFGMSFALLTAALGLLLVLALLSGLGEMGSRELGGLACLSLLLLAALIGAALTADTVNLFVWFEVAALSSYGLTGFFLEQPPALEATFKALVLVSIGGFVVFAGSAMLYAQVGALNFGQLHDALPHRLGRAELLGLGLLLAGYATKAGLAPFHGWLPDAHAQGPTAVPALFSALMVDLGVVAIVRLVLQVYGPDTGHHVLGLLTALGIASALLGAVMALAQDDLKRLLAWDTISQVGIMIVGFASAEDEGVAGAVFQMVNHGLFKALLFLCAGAVVHTTGVTRLSGLGGLARRRPIVTGCFTIGALAIAGVPGFNAYASLGLIHTGIERSPVVFLLAVLAQVVTVAAFARAAWLGFYRRRAEPYETLERTPSGMAAVLVVLAAACVGVGVVPYVVLRDMVTPAASILLDPAGYAHAVLHGGGTVAATVIPFSYGKGSDLVLAAVEIGLGLLLACWYLQVREPRPVSWLRRLHTGSVNDYAGYLTAGLVLTAAVLFG
jgi:multicomponent Na+:H+ antiporter subunit D